MMKRRYPDMRTTVVALLTLLIVSASVGAQQLGCPEGNRPLLKVVGYSKIHDTPPPWLSEARYSELICTGGVVASFFFRGHGASPLPVRFTATKGTAPEADRLRLVGAMADARIGFLEDCQHPSSSAWFDHEVDITWFGTPPRVNRFRVVTNDPVLPYCDDATVDLIEEILGIAGAAATSPGAEVLEIP
jgi:hypothetical protein